MAMLCDYSDGQILAKGSITITNTAVASNGNKKVITNLMIA